MKCIIDDCVKKSKCKGLCWMHYKRQQLETKRDDYNDYHRKYQAEHIDKVNDYHQTSTFKISHNNSQKKYYEKCKVKNNG